MMDLLTTVTLPGDLPRIGHAHRLLLIGSCFATGMGERLRAAKFRCDTNPYGVLYNPSSIATALRQILAGKVYDQNDLYEHNGLWHSPMHHSDFSAFTIGETLQRINSRLQAASATVDSLDFLLLTFGSAVVYQERASGVIVGNCHKLPEKNFIRRRLLVGQIIADYVSLLSGLFARRPQLTVYFTVSPVRYLRDGLHDSQLSKASLLLAVDEICRAFPERAFYFPAYEIVTDELRDYRFYADDMVHPTALAVDYVWQRFVQACIRPEVIPVMDACREINKMLSHKPFRPDSDEYKRFLEQIVLKIDRLNEKYPYLDFQNEKESCRILLNRFQTS